jgi:polyhydroxyalkanoate synthesis regulator phasin
MAIKIRFLQNMRIRAIVIAVLIIALVASGVGIYMHYMSTKDQLSGGASVKGIPQVQFNPGAQNLSKEYLKTLLQSTKQESQEALKTGESDVPTLINVSNVPTDLSRSLTAQSEVGGSFCQECVTRCETCQEGVAGKSGCINTNSLLNRLVQQNKLSSAVAAKVANLQKQSATADDYKTALDKLIKAGTLTSDQEKELLNAYNKDKAAGGSSASKLADQLVSAGSMGSEVASQLKALSDGGATLGDYQNALNGLVKAGKLTPAQAKELLSAYRQDHGLNPTSTASQLADQLLHSGAIKSDVASQLKALSDKGATLGDYQAALNKLVKTGKLTPAQTKQLLAAYRKDHGLSAIPKASQLADQLTGSGAIGSDVASQLKDLSDSGASLGDYKDALDKLTQAGKLTPDQEKSLLSAYRQDNGLSPTSSASQLADKLAGSGAIGSDIATQLKELSDAGASLDDYQAALNNLVKSSKLTQAQADQLLSAYKKDHNALGRAVKTDALLASLANAGDIGADIASQLKGLADGGASIGDYQTALNRLAKAGKLTPAQSKELMATYRKDHGLSGASTANQIADQLAKAGDIGSDVASQLKSLADSGASVGAYKSALDQLTKAGKLSPEQEKSLLSAYRQDHGLSGTSQASNLVDQLAGSGAIASDVASQLKGLSDGGASLDDYNTALDKLVQAGKLTPTQEDELLAAYRKDNGLKSTSKASQLAEQLASSGALDADTASQLEGLSDSGVSVGDYNSALDKLAQAGKLTPDQEKILLATYRKDHGLGVGLPAASQLADQLANNGAIDADTASSLKTLSDSGASLGDYKAALDKLVKSGKLTPDQEQQLLAAYRKDHGLSGGTSAGKLADQLSKSGDITAGVASQLKTLANSGASVDAYKSALDKLAQGGQLTPAQEKELLTAYHEDHGLKAPSSAKDIVNQLQKAGKLSATEASQLRGLSDLGASADTYKKILNGLVKQGKLTSKDAKDLLAAYKQDQSPQKHFATTGATKVAVTTPAATGIVEAAATPAASEATAQKKSQVSQEVADQLAQLSKNNATPLQYAQKLNSLVNDGKLSPQDAKQLLTKYQAQKTGAIPTADTATGRAYQAQQQQALSGQEQQLSDKEQQALAQQRQQAQAAAEAKLQALENAMKRQATALVDSWGAVPQTLVKATKASAASTDGLADVKNAGGTTTAGQGGSKGGSSTSATTKSGKKAGDTASGTSADSSGSDEVPQGKPPFVKAGTIMFAVLDTAVNSDRQGVVMATVVSGKLKGAKMFGGIQQTSDGERVVLKFNQLTKDDWPKTIGINAVAINPDTAQQAIASSVNNHYVLRYSSLFAANFLSGYSDAISQSGSTIYDNSLVRQEYKTDLSARERFMMGLGQVGKSLSDSANKLFNRKPTVKVDAGVGLGILFSSDVTI